MSIEPLVCPKCDLEVSDTYEPEGWCYECIVANNTTPAEARALTAEADNARLREALNSAYRERNELAAAVAPWHDAWIGHDSEEPDWPVLYMQFPTGQVSYHFSPEDAHLLEGICEGRSYEHWDGHTQQERSIRLWRASRSGQLAALAEPSTEGGQA